MNLQDAVETAEFELESSQIEINKAMAELDKITKGLPNNKVSEL